MTSMLHENNRSRTLSSSDHSWMRLVEEKVQQWCAADGALVVNAALVEPMSEDEEEENKEEGMG